MDDETEYNPVHEGYRSHHAQFGISSKQLYLRSIVKEELQRDVLRLKHLHQQDCLKSTPNCDDENLSALFCNTRSTEKV